MSDQGESLDQEQTTKDDVSKAVFFTPRSLLLALLAVIGFSILIPWNDWFLRNTYLNNHYMPLGLTLVLLFMGMVLNPLLGRLRLRAGEIVVVATVMLALAGITSSGLMRMLPFMMAAPADVLPTNPRYTLFAEREEDASDRQGGEIQAWNVPHQLWMGVPETGDIDRNDAEHRYLVEGYLSGLSNRGADVRVDHRTRVTWRDPQGTIHENQLALSGRLAAERVDDPGVLNLDEPGRGAALRGQRPGRVVLLSDGQAEILAVQEAPIPWLAWWSALLAWSPLLLGSILACVGIAGLVRRQWIHNERLPYPIAAVTYSLLEDPDKGQRFAAIFRNKAFWAGLAISGLIIAWRGLYAYDLVPVDIQLSMNLFEGEDAPFAGAPWNQTYQPRWVFRPQIFFSIIALTFFLALDLSFSLWFFFLATNVVFLLLRTSGIPISGNHVAQAGVGGFFAECILILWVGRQYYGRVLAAACGWGRHPEARAAAPYLWVLLGGCLAMWLFFVSLGSPMSLAALIILLFLGFMLVLARIVAEAGVPYIGVPTGAFINSVFFSLVGVGFPVAMIMPLSVIGMTLLADSREALLPYAVNAEFLGDRVAAPRWRMSGVFLAAAAIAIVISLGTMVYFSYTGSGHPDAYGRHVLQSELSGIASQAEHAANPAAAEIVARQRSETLLSYGAGALIVIILGIGRMLLSWWPFHPIGYLASMTYATWNIWFSFFLGWLIKAVVMRYGGTALYKSLKPAAIGLIAGEALAGGSFMVIKIIAYLHGMDVPDFKFLPG